MGTCNQGRERVEARAAAKADGAEKRGSGAHTPATGATRREGVGMPQQR